MVAKQGLGVLAALLHRASLAAASDSESTFSPSILIHLANVRSQLKIPMTAVGNHNWRYMVEVKKLSICSSQLCAIFHFSEWILDGEDQVIHLVLTDTAEGIEGNGLFGGRSDVNVRKQ